MLALGELLDAACASVGLLDTGEPIRPTVRALPILAGMVSE